MIVVVGEALVDVVVTDAGSMTSHLGGGPFNTARALGRLEVPVAFAGRLSDDRFGRQLQESLVASDVDISFAPITSDPTTLAMVELDERGAASYRFYFDGTSAPGLDEAAIAPVLAQSIDALHLGTLGLMLEPVASTSIWLAGSVPADTLVYVDPNIRPAIIGDRHDDYLATLGRLLPRADVVKVSDDDLAWMYPHLDQVAGAEQLLSAGAALVFVTRGGEGVDVVSATGMVHVAAANVTVSDTIGAGDSFSAGVLRAWTAAGKPEFDLTFAQEAAQFGVRVAGVTVSRPGADSPNLGDL